MRNRQKQRDHRRIHREERLDTRNDGGYFDLTAYMAVAKIKRDETISMKAKKEGDR